MSKGGAGRNGAFRERAARPYIRILNRTPAASSAGRRHRLAGSLADMNKSAVMAIGGGIGLLWMGMAFLSLLSAMEGLRNARFDWLMGWGLVGGLLLLAGAAALAGTWNHLYRVLRNE
jgi:hypothetical protein